MITFTFLLGKPKPFCLHDARFCRLDEKNAFICATTHMSVLRLDTARY